MYWLFMDFRFLYILLPAILLGLYAQFKVKSTYSKYSRVNNSRGWTAAQVARKILDDNGLYDVQIAHISGSLTDNFNPKTMTVSLSDTVYSSSSVAAIGVAAHECGHAVQHAEQYLPIKIRSALVPVTNFGSSIGFIVLAAGLIFSNYSIAMFGVLLYSLMAVFQLVTLPVEYNASSRALKTLEQSLILDDEEVGMAKKVLSAAALTYVAALVSTLATILRLLLIVNSSTRRRD
ncbi:MAG TPA: zinc metallopeptidase [Candidatus Faeciplasma pullistercoris]|uniref:Zinc metallopeptidase n=1 Tax=Candidatus Faeciplasma pullistercoris TaxID=2840800 RepID=A0A9D1GUC5_9FIRM|nr:zinc metallopeptidase [Candidatus Faeciplasma pullistercoris]